MNFRTQNESTIEELENDYWKLPQKFPTSLVKNVFDLRKIKIKDLSSSDIRLLISQNIGTKYLVPVAIEILKINLLEESLYFPGDLLLAVLNVTDKYWKNNSEQKRELSEILTNYDLASEKMSAQINDDINQTLLQAIDKFI